MEFTSIPKGFWQASHGRTTRYFLSRREMRDYRRRMRADGVETKAGYQQITVSANTSVTV